MKIKCLSEFANIDKTLSLLSEIKQNDLISDPNTQVLKIDDDEIILEGVNPSETLSNILINYPDYSVSYDPNELNTFDSEDGIKDIDKVGSVQSPIVSVEIEQLDDLSSIEMFNEEELNNQIESFNNNMKRKRNFNEPALDENGVAVKMKEPAVEADQAKETEDYNPAAGSLSSFDVTPFTDEEVEQANDVTVELNGNEDVKVFDEEPYQEMEEVVSEVVNKVDTFTDEEIENMDVPEEVDAATEILEDQVVSFSNRKKRLYSAKIKLHRLNNRSKKLKTFAEELSEEETKEVIEDIIAILEDAPEIKEEVMKSVGEEMTDEAVDTAVREDEKDTADESVEVTEVVEEVTEPEMDVTEEVVEDEVSDDVEAFTEEEIESAEEMVEEPEMEDEEDEDEDDEVEEDLESTEAGEIFCKSFCVNDVMSYRRSVLDEMAKSSSSRFNR